MAALSDTYVILGAIFGVIAVYLTPYQVEGVATRNKMKKCTNKNRSAINVPEGSHQFVNNESTAKFYGDTTLNDVLGIIKMEISKLLSGDKWTIILPKEKISEALPDFCDARNQFTTVNSDIPLDSVEINGIQDDCTEYKDIPNMFLSTSNCNKKNKKKKRRKFCRGISCLDVPKDDKNVIKLPRQSTLINSKSKKNSKCVILGEDTLDELETFAADSGFSVITIENDNIELSFKKSKSPINRLFHEVKKFLGLKKKSNQESNNFSE